MNEETIRATSRRTFLTYGTLSTGLLVGASDSSAAVDAAPSDRDRTAVDRGVMLPYQFAPNGRSTVVESDLGWRPERLADPYRTHVIASDRAPSYRAFLFTETTLERDRSLVVGPVRGAPSGPDGRFVTVELEAADP